jgi:hypothetical protein
LSDEDRQAIIGLARAALAPFLPKPAAIPAVVPKGATMVQKKP